MRVQAVGEALPVFIVPAKSVELVSMDGDVPQEETVGVVPEEMTWLLFWTPKLTVPLTEEIFKRKSLAEDAGVELTETNGFADVEVDSANRFVEEVPTT